MIDIKSRVATFRIQFLQFFSRYNLTVLNECFYCKLEESIFHSFLECGRLLEFFLIF